MKCVTHVKHHCVGEGPICDIRNGTTTQKESYHVINITLHGDRTMKFRNESKKLLELNVKIHFLIQKGSWTVADLAHQNGVDYYPRTLSIHGAHS